MNRIHAGRPRRAICITALLAATATHGTGQSKGDDSAGQEAVDTSDPKSNLVRIDLLPTLGQAARPLSVASLMWPTIRIARRGELVIEADATHEAARVDLYLPALKRFPLVNPGRNSSSFENKSAFFYLDQDRDGTLAADEAWFCNLPFRVDDRMLEVTAIAKDGAWIEVGPSDAPLAGAIRGRALPTLEVTTMAGESVTAPRDFLGKHLVIQVWSPT